MVGHGGLMCHLPLTPGQTGQNDFFSPKFDEKCKKNILEKNGSNENFGFLPDILT